MKRIKKIMYYLLHPIYIVRRHKLKKLNNKDCQKMDDTTFIKAKFKLTMGYKLDLENPKTFNEKLNWLKLYDHKDLYTIMVDKHKVKKYVSNIIGEKYVAKELGVFKHSKDIKIDSLPNKFVLKTNHGCGGMIICRNKNYIDWDKELNKLEKSLNSNYFYNCREWPYKNVSPLIIAEEYLEDGEHDVLPVYKIFCFNGEPFLIQAIKNDKQPNETIDYFDLKWNRLKLKQNYPNSKKPLSKPNNLNEMLILARKLTKNIPFVRCDLFSANGNIYFSEFTFYSDAGFEKFHPKIWDKKLGDLIILPENKNI